MLGIRLRQRQPLPPTRHEHGVALQDEWNNLKQAHLGLLVRSIPRRICVCLANRGRFKQH